MSLTGRLHSMASGSFRDAKLERPVSGAELRRLLVASRPTAVIEASAKLPISRTGLPRVSLLGSCRSPPHTLGQLRPLSPLADRPVVRRLHLDCCQSASRVSGISKVWARSRTDAGMRYPSVGLDGSFRSTTKRDTVGLGEQRALGCSSLEAIQVYPLLPSYHVS